MNRRTLPIAAALAVVALSLAPAPDEPALAATITDFSGTVSINGSLTVGAGETLRFDPGTDTTVEIAGNLVVNGTLEMKPAPGVEHVLRFVGVNEAGFSSGGMSVLESDRGLWVMGAGRLDLLGQPKVGWNRTGTDPSWLAGDEIRVAPTNVADYGTDGFATFAPGSIVPRADPSLPPAEVINLTRSVTIEGTPAGRSHVFINSSSPQSIRYVRFRYMGPRQAEGNATVGVVGRYPLHFHMMGEGSRGSLVEGSVVVQSGNRAFVTHLSNGITLRGNVAYDVMDTPFWWDEGDPSDDILWEGNFAGYTRTDPPLVHSTTAGFRIGPGVGNVATGNVAAGINGTGLCAGFQWGPEGEPQWIFTNNLAHNVRCHGARVWRNDSVNVIVDDYIAYRNGEAGINHGAYGNSFIYRDIFLFQNVEVGIINHTFSKGVRPGVDQQTWSCVSVVGSPIAMRVMHSGIVGNTPVLMENLVISGVGRLVEVSEGALVNGQTLLRRVDYEAIGLACGSAAAPDLFVDDEGSFHEPDIQVLARALVTKGCAPTLFCPSAPVTRGQMAAFLVRALGLPAEDVDYFTDDQASIFAADINALAQWEITKGCAAGVFCPDGNVTRGEMAAFLVRALDLPASTSDSFSDDQASIFAADINALAAAGITQGCAPGLFCPNSLVTRAQMASFIVRAMGLN